MSPISRRDILAGMGAAAGLAAMRPFEVLAEPDDIRFGYAAITWNGEDRRAIEDIAALGFKGIQLRSNILAEFGGRPAALRDLLQKHDLIMVALSSGNMTIDPAKEADDLATHTRNARFVKDVGGLYLQVTDARPRGRAIVPDDQKRLGRLLTELGKRTADIGIPLGYHNHMNSLGEAPDEVDRVLDAADPRYVKLELDIAHYQQGGGDPVRAIDRHADRLLFLHIKDLVSPFEPPDGPPKAYEFVELGRGKVDVPAVFAALERARFKGWAVIELDRVTVPGRTPKEAAAISKRYVETALKRKAAFAAGTVEVKVDESAKRVDITVGGDPFTSYVWPATLKKPVLYPLRTAKGTPVTRGFPLDPRPRERVDHPHHVGLWLNHGDVNGLDFWNNSDAIAPDQAPKMGTIEHRRIVSAKSGSDTGELTVETAWMTPANQQLLREITTFTFRGGADARTIDRITTLTALDEKVVFRDSKEGFIGMRVRRELEQPADRPEVFTDASGNATAVPALDNAGVSGRYVSSEGKEGDAVWSTRAKWTLLGGIVGREPVTLAILDHPSNVGYPTHWHARGYGLFAANPLGDRQLNEPRELNYTLEPGTSVTFRYRILILSAAPSRDRVEEQSQAFARLTAGALPAARR